MINSFFLIFQYLLYLESVAFYAFNPIKEIKLINN